MSGCVLSALQHSFSQGFIFLNVYFLVFYFNNFFFYLPSELLTKFLRSSHSRLLLCDQESAERCLAAKDECPDLKEVFVLGKFEGCIPFDRLLDQQPFNHGKNFSDILNCQRDVISNKEVALIPDELRRPEPYDPDETVSMVFSSGTTGERKGVLLTQLNIYSYLLTARYSRFTMLQFSHCTNSHHELYFDRPKANKPGMKTLFVPRIGNVMGLVFGLRGVLIYTETYLLSKYKDEWLFDAIEQIKVSCYLF